LAPSLEQYETLIDSAQLLPDVSDDLSSLSQDYPEVPRVRRLLGDVFMRRGMLQEALNAYRSALEQL
jgi:predicted negative regulator of RcsB-dependent stress response